MLRHPRFLAVLAILALAACGPEVPGEAGSATALAGGKWGEAPPEHSNAGGKKHVKVMTRNLYLGGDINTLIVAIASGADPLEIAGLAAQTWAQVQQTNFPERAKVLADEIAKERPMLIGLQEAELWLTGPGDICEGQAATHLTVVYDFIQILQGELQGRGLDYDVVSTVQNFTGAVCAANATTAPMDVALVDRDAILVRKGVTTANPQAENYVARVQFPAGSGVPDILRGWTSIDVEHEGVSFRFFETHLEEEMLPQGYVQMMQAAELIQMLADVELPVIAVGDFNAGPQVTTTSTYDMLLGAGYGDAWAALHPSRDALSCCFASDLVPVKHEKLATRIDLTLFKGAVSPSTSKEIGLHDRTASGLHPSDHAGFVSTFRIESPKSSEWAER